MLRKVKIEIDYDIPNDCVYANKEVVKNIFTRELINNNVMGYYAEEYFEEMTIDVEDK